MIIKAKFGLSQEIHLGLEGLYSESIKYDFYSLLVGKENKFRHLTRVELSEKILAFQQTFFSNEHI